MPRHRIKTHLKDGTLVKIRFVRPSDKHLLEVGLAHLSDRSRYFRFLRPVTRLTDEELEYFTATYGDDHVALGALDISTPEAMPVGVARYVRPKDDPERAEIAVTVVDSHQGRGLGTMLVGALAAHAVKHGVREFVALVHADNAAMLRIFHELGAEMVQSYDTEMELSVPLHRDPACYPKTLAGDAARRAYEQFAELG